MNYYCSMDYLTGMLRPLFYFTASKYVLIKDPRLGGILRILQLCILAYVMVGIFMNATYMAVEAPTGVITVWPDGQSMTAKEDEFKSQTAAVGDLKYCTDPAEYDFEWSGVKHDAFECAFLDPASLVIDEASQVFLTTSMRVEKMHHYTKDASGNCMDAADLGEGVRGFGGMEDACGYTEAKGYFPILPEDISLNLIHSYRTSPAVNKRGSMPKTIIRAPDFSSDDIIIKAGEPMMSLTLERLLNIAGVDLDKRLDDQENASSEDKSQAMKKANGELQYPYARLSGVTLDVNFNYYTRRLAPSPHNKHVGDNSDDIVCIVDVKPLNKWTFMGSDIRMLMNSPSDPRFITPSLLKSAANQSGDPELIASQTDIQRNGVRIVFSVSGKVGSFSLNALIGALVNGSVLLAVAQLITTYLAIYAFGIRSELYRAFMKETVDFRQEYARYAAQACVAGYVFERYDTNNSGSLDRSEIFRLLQKIMSKNEGTEDWQIAALTDFLMREGDIGTDDTNQRSGNLDGLNQGGSKDDQIDRVEWIDIFTEDKAHWKALTRLIDHLYPDQESRQKVLQMVHKSRTMNHVPEESDGTPHASTRNSQDVEANLETPFLNHRRKTPSVPPRQPRASF